MLVIFQGYDRCMRSVDGLCGAAIVARAGSVALELAAGLADAEAGAMCTPQTRFQVASVSKQFVAAAVMLLAESGMVALGEPVDRWLPGSQWRRVTLHHLLTHTSGIGHWGDAPGFDPAQPMYPDDRLALIEQAPLRTEPGTRWHYSSPGYLLAGQIVARGSGRPYADFVTERILDPLELTSTTAGSVRSSAAIARGYRDRALVPPWDLSEMPGTGDICSTVGDVARVSAAVHSGSLLTGSSRRALRAVHTPLSGDQGSGDDWLTGYGYGLFIGKICGHAAYLQPGDVPGYKSFSAWLPEHAASIVILANNENVDMENLLRQLLPAALQLPRHQLRLRLFSKADASSCSVAGDAGTLVRASSIDAREGAGPLALHAGRRDSNSGPAPGGRAGRPLDHRVHARTLRHPWPEGWRVRLAQSASARHHARPRKGPAMRGHRGQHPAQDAQAEGTAAGMRTVFDPGIMQDLPYRGSSNLMAQPDEFAWRAPVPPRRIVRRYADHESRAGPPGVRHPWPLRARPSPSDS